MAESTVNGREGNGGVTTQTTDNSVAFAVDEVAYPQSTMLNDSLAICI